jgi:hypothetical protein
MLRSIAEDQRTGLQRMSALRQSLIRSCAEEGIRPAAVPYSATSYHAFRVCQGHSGHHDTPLGGRTYDYGRVEADTLDGALTAALSLPQVIDHKEHLVIQEISERGVKLHVYAIKRKAAPRYVHKDHVTRRVHDLYAAPVCSIDGNLLRAAL